MGRLPSAVLYFTLLLEKYKYNTNQLLFYIFPPSLCSLFLILPDNISQEEKSREFYIHHLQCLSLLLWTFPAFFSNNFRIIETLNKKYEREHFRKGNRGLNGNVFNNRVIVYNDWRFTIIKYSKCNENFRKKFNQYLNQGCFNWAKIERVLICNQILWVTEDKRQTTYLQSFVMKFSSVRGLKWSDRNYKFPETSGKELQINFH